MKNRTQKYTTLSIALLTAFLPGYGMSGVNVAIPSIAREFGMTSIELSWITTAYIMVAAICMVPFSKLADIYGRKKMLIIGAAIFTSGVTASLFVNSGLMFIIVRAVQGMGVSLFVTTSLAILSAVYPDNERGKGLGIQTAANYLGLSVGPLLGGVLTQYFG